MFPTSATTIVTLYSALPGLNYVIEISYELKDLWKKSMTLQFIQCFTYTKMHGHMNSNTRDVIRFAR